MGATISTLDSSRDKRVEDLSKYLSQLIVNPDRKKRGTILDKMINMFSSKENAKSIRFMETANDLIQLTQPTMSKQRGFLVSTINAEDITSYGAPISEEMRQSVYTGYTYIVSLLYLFSLIFTLYPTDTESMARLIDLQDTISKGIGKDGIKQDKTSTTDGVITRYYSDILRSVTILALQASRNTNRDKNALFYVESTNMNRIIENMGDNIRRYVDPTTKKERYSEDELPGASSMKKGALMWQQVLSSLNYLSFCEKSPSSLNQYLKSNANAGMIDMMMKILSMTLDRIRSDGRIATIYTREIYEINSLINTFKIFDMASTADTSFRDHLKLEMEGLSKLVEAQCSSPYRVSKSDKPLIVNDKQSDIGYKQYLNTRTTATPVYNKISKDIALLHTESLKQFDSIFSISPTRIAGTLCFPIKQEKDIIFLCIKPTIIRSDDPERMFLYYLIQLSRLIMKTYSSMFLTLKNELGSVISIKAPTGGLFV